MVRAVGKHAPSPPAKARGAFGCGDKQTQAAGGTTTAWPFARKRVDPPVDPGRVRVEHDDDESRVDEARLGGGRLAVVR
jgi:hypothetical protein